MPHNLIISSVPSRSLIHNCNCCMDYIHHYFDTETPKLSKVAFSMYFLDHILDKKINLEMLGNRFILIAVEGYYYLMYSSLLKYMY